MQRDRKYLEWIRTLPCLICQRKGLPQRSITNAHHHGPRGLGQKVPDRQAIPLCHEAHHQYGKEAVHVLGKKFGDHHGIDVFAEIKRLNEQYDALNSKTCGTAYIQEYAEQSN